MPDFDKQSTRRLIQATKFVEQQPRSRAKLGKGPSVLFPMRVGYTTSTITARSGNVAGNGTFRFCQFGGSTGYQMLYTSEAQQTAVNITGGTIPSGSYVLVGFVSGKLCAFVADCLSTTNPGAPAAASTSTGS